jgi:hypothetical protein
LREKIKDLAFVRLKINIRRHLIDKRRLNGGIGRWEALIMAGIASILKYRDLWASIYNIWYRAVCKAV